MVLMNFFRQVNKISQFFFGTNLPDFYRQRVIIVIVSCFHLPDDLILILKAQGIYFCHNTCQRHLKINKPKHSFCLKFFFESQLIIFAGSLKTMILSNSEKQVL